MDQIYDLVVIGGGPAGYVAAIRASQLGLKTACLDQRKVFGGTCLNVGCIPSKTLLDSSEHYLQLKKGLGHHGIEFENLKLNLAQMMKRKEKVVSSLVGGVGSLLKKNKVDGIPAKGELMSQRHSSGAFQIKLHEEGKSDQTLVAKKVLLATGSEPIQLPFMPFDGKKILSSTEILSLEKVPEHLIVVGGGVIGLEMGSVWHRLGAKVSVIEYQDRICPFLDLQVAKEFHKILTKQGLEFHLSTKCLGAKIQGDRVHIEMEDLVSKTNKTLEGDLVLVATGRRPYSKGLGVEAVGIELDRQGRVPVAKDYQTKVPGIYAVGDLIEGPMLAHKAEDEGIAAVERMVGQAGHVNYLAIPNVIYTWPEVAVVGLNEEELKAAGRDYHVGSFPFLANGRAKAIDATEGFVKILSDAKTDRLLGAHIIGPWASDLIGELVSVMEFNGSAEDVARTCHAHPTLSEVVKEAAMAVSKRQIHL